MKELLHYLVSRIVNTPDAVEIDEQVAEDGMVKLTIHVNQKDMGKVIGKGGKTIQAIRDVVKILATKNNEYVDVQIEDTV